MLEDGQKFIWITPGVTIKEAIVVDRLPAEFWHTKRSYISAGVVLAQGKWLASFQGLFFGSELVSHRPCSQREHIGSYLANLFGCNDQTEKTHVCQNIWR